jgi:hypothetical protein
MLHSSLSVAIRDVLIISSIKEASGPNLYSDTVTFLSFEGAERRSCLFFNSSQRTWSPGRKGIINDSSVIWCGGTLVSGHTGALPFVLGSHLLALLLTRSI